MAATDKPATSAAPAPAAAAGSSSSAAAGGASSLAAAAPAPAAAAATSTTTTTKKKKATAKKATGAGTKAKAKKPAAKRKRPVKKDTVSVDTILAEGNAAQKDLEKQRAGAAQRRLDPLWYRIEDVIGASEGAAMVAHNSGASSNILPEQVDLVERALATSGGLTRADVTPQAMACLLEQARRYAAELLGDAADYAYTAGRPDVSKADLLLAKEMRPDPIDTNVMAQLPKRHLEAQAINRAPLPAIPVHCYSGVVLPDKQHQLTARTFDVVSTALDLQKRVQPLPLSPNQLSSSTNNTSAKKKSSGSSSTVGYGVSRGRQIPIHLKERATSNEGGGGGGSSSGPTPMDTSPTNAAAAAPAPAAAAAPAPAAAASSGTMAQTGGGTAAAAAATSTAAAAAASTAATPKPQA